jgi:signal transduction histidine kinase
MQNHVETFSPQAAISAVCTVIGPMARKKRIQLHPPAPASSGFDTVALDQQKFKQILLNLLSNAVKFTEPGGRVAIDIDADGEQGFRVTVRDTGIGISPADMGRLFEAFRQLDGGPSRRHDGTGLGLALTRKLVELQGGRIEVQSRLGEGSSFSVHLPRALPLAADHP